MKCASTIIKAKFPFTICCLCLLLIVGFSAQESCAQSRGYGESCKTPDLGCGCDQPANDADGDGAVTCPTNPSETQDQCDNDPNKTVPGICGCGVPDDDTDGDGTADCLDGCANDADKTAPGICGCGTPDTDTDGDGTADCIDGCPNDPAKINRGICGCGVADTDTDSDGTPDCNDGCVNDGNKITPGICGCGTADTDTDGDGTPDCNDECATDPNKTSEGQCGCGNADTDTDSDGTADCNDLCPSDPNKTTLGVCGCGTADTDSDGDGTPDCQDQCPSDGNKTSIGVCGCGTPDTDSDGDGTADCDDGCANDANKVVAGQCGCGTPDTDSDGDGTADCNDDCANDANKLTPGACGCGTPDTDSDGDGTANCIDGCPNDATKLNAGSCGCGTPDTDSDSDGTPNCNDGCPNDGSKTSGGICGCGTPDTDSDGDGTANCNDGCPSDGSKTSGGQCGCGNADTDDDGDGTANCNDGCPSDVNKTNAGACGCGNPETDTDGDGTPDCIDPTPLGPCQYFVGEAYYTTVHNTQTTRLAETGKKLIDGPLSELHRVSQNPGSCNGIGLAGNPNGFTRCERLWCMLNSNKFDNKTHFAQLKNAAGTAFLQGDANKDRSKAIDDSFFAFFTGGAPTDATKDTWVSFTMDSDCNLVAGPVDPSLTCGEYTVQAVQSPVSLLWDENVEIDDNVSVSNFPLELGKTDQWFTWKASAATPLVVYDPEHTGKITSAAQLFGNWTFGGQRSAALTKGNYDISATATGTPWENGYQALALMDYNGNGQVDGSELEPLALWFDHNKNGRSEAGEVKSLISVGVTKLFYLPDYKDPVTGDIHAATGFERVIDGVASIGRSVDWYGNSSDTYVGAIVSNQFRGARDPELVAPRDVTTPSAKVTQSEVDTGKDILTPSQVAALRQQVEGGWTWAVKNGIPGEDGNYIPTGIMFLKVSTKGVTGYSFTMNPLEKAPKGEKHMLTFGGIKGTIGPSFGSMKSITFRVVGPNGQDTESTASVSKDGLTMAGRSTTLIRRRPDLPNTQPIEYEWIATKVTQ